MNDVVQNDVGPEHSIQEEDWIHYKRWLRPRDDRKLFEQFSAVCFLYAMYMTDLLRRETGQIRRFGLMQVNILATFIMQYPHTT